MARSISWRIKLDLQPVQEVEGWRGEGEIYCAVLDAYRCSQRTRRVDGTGLGVSSSPRRRN